MMGLLTRPRRLTRTQRRVLVTLHVALSVGWLGASMVMLTLAVAARTGQPAEQTRGVYWAMHLVADVLLIPLSLSVLLIGVLVAVTSPWGLLRYWWVTIKLIATCAAVTLSLLALPALTSVAYRDAIRHAMAAEHSAGNRLIIAGSVSVVLYLSLTAVSVLKPWGRTARGRRHASQQHSASIHERSST